MMENGKNPLVSICCITYNHEPYIRQCLEGFVMQRTNFWFEAIVHDDASTDKTAIIVREYAEKYPDIIKPLYESENQYSKGVRGIFAHYCFPHAKGKYIALCEGDDYWTDPYKLQKQVDFLENNPDFSLCFHNRKICENGEVKRDSYHVTQDVFERNSVFSFHIPTLTVAFRRSVMEEDSRFITLDASLWIYLSSKGRIKYLDFYGAVYRIHSGGVWSGNTTLINITRSLDARILAFRKFNGVDKRKLARVICVWLCEQSDAAIDEKKHALLFRNLFLAVYFSFYSHSIVELKRIVGLSFCKNRIEDHIF